MVLGKDMLKRSQRQGESRIAVSQSLSDLGSLQPLVYILQKAPRNLES